MAADHDSIEPVLLYLKNRKDWKIYDNYDDEFKTSPCVGYTDETCLFYTSLYKSKLQHKSTELKHFG